VESNVREILAYNVRKLRKSLGYSQDALGELTGLSRSYIGDVERARHNVGIGNLDVIAACLDVSVSELFEPVEMDAENEVTEPVIEVRMSQFQELLNQCLTISFRPDLVIIYLQRCGVTFV
jgi:transcriptional regulator with XRE-family HTH domain